MDPDESKWWILVDPCRGSWLLPVVEPGGSQLPVVDPGVSTLLILVAPGCGTCRIQVVYLSIRSIWNLHDLFIHFAYLFEGI